MIEISGPDWLLQSRAGGWAAAGSLRKEPRIGHRVNVSQYADDIVIWEISIHHQKNQQNLNDISSCCEKWGFEMPTAKYWIDNGV